MDVLTLISIGISITSGVITTICIVIHHLIPKLKRNPGQLILVQCYLQLILDLRWVFQLKSLEKYYYENSVLCTIVSILNSLAVVMSYSYIVCLAIEVHIQIKYKMVPIHGKRVKIYHFASSFLGIFFLLFAIFTKSLGKTKVGNCSVKDFSPAAILNFGFLLICTLLLWYFVIASGLLLKDRHSKLIKRFLLILLLFTSMVSISYSLAYIEVAFSNIILIKISIIISASLGSVIGVCRLYNKMLYREIMWVLCKKKMKTHKIQKTQKNSIQVELKSTLIIDSFNKSESDPISLSEYFEIANLKTILKMLCALALRFSKICTDIEKLSNSNNYFFQEHQYLEVLEILNICDYEELYDPNLYITEYKPEIFVKIREKNGIESEDLEGTFLNYENFKKLKNLKIFDGGKSNSTIFPTNDQRFVLKIITNDERLVLLSILQGYYERICKEPDSKLVRIYGLFSIFPDKIHLMLMENIVTDRENAVIFDLKGSLVNRKSKISSFPITDSVLKDENYLENSIKIILDEENEKILNTIRDDFQFLFEQEIIDYSLLIGFEYEKIRTNRSLRLSDSVKIGIIDILQKYTKKKKYEKRLKSIFYDAFQISAADPASYFARISGFLNQIFISNNS